ncbi:uncharacterized protein JN550_005683 [Neoarthrinium moseri]|uniref:uncharacterized protein n=1 Tax=Neoarthrinium moseri TaxID=1658444 RepID=UPI001FDC8943|nr:uncharacterized protein JN550_005683 [Neoarthrinium moseri]KAI1869702.1 hypothetical protein JN550_005683 [Neoarthrinium moseri]
MPSFVTVAYPRPSGEVKFDLKYYLESHMPLVQKTWAEHGLKSWTVTEHAEGPYVITAALKWDNLGAFDAAVAALGGAEIFADVPKFTDIKPILLKGDVKGYWSA